MNILSLEIDNFLAIGQARLTLNNQGLVLLQGENLDDTSALSNGVGKSSIPDALCWCNYGNTARDETGDAVVNRKVKKNCRVRTVWEDGATQYAITRHRKHSVHKNQTLLEQSTDGGATWTDLSKATEKETQEEVVKIIGCSLDVFKASIYAGQEVTPDLPKMTDKNLKLLVEEAAGVDRLEGAYKIANGKLTTKKAELAGAVSTRDNVANQLHQAEVDLATRRIEHQQFEDGRPHRAKTFQMQAATLRAEIVDLAGKLKVSGEPEKAARAAEIAKLLSEHSRSERAVMELGFAVEDANKVLTRSQINFEATMIELRRAKDGHDNAEEEMKKPCTECGKPHTAEEMGEFKAHAMERVKRLAAEAKGLQAVNEANKKKLNEAVTERDTARSALPDVSHLTAEQSTLNAELKAIERMKTGVQGKKKDFDRAREQAADVMKADNPYTVAVADIETRVEALKKGLVTAGSKIAALEDEVEVLNDVAKVFSPAGVRAHILDTVTPFLNDRTSDYLSALSDGNITAVWTTIGETAKGELREKFNIDVQNTKGAESFNGLSGGEKRKVRLSTMLALQDLVASRATKSINLYIGDEIDDALDRAGLERLMTILERKARERGTVLVVSHADLRDWIDNVCTVTKQPTGISEISGALAV